MAFDWTLPLTALLAGLAGVVTAAWTLRGTLERSLSSVTQELALLAQEVRLTNRTTEERFVRLETKSDGHSADLREVRESCIGRHSYHPHLDPARTQ